MWYKAGLAFLLMAIFIAVFVLAAYLTGAWGELIMFSFLPAVVGFVMMLGSAMRKYIIKDENNSDNESKE